MTAYIVRRLVGMALNLWLVSLFVFTMLQLVPGDIAQAVLGLNGTQEQYSTFRAENHLNDPVLKRYWRWVSDAAQGDLGRSLKTKFPVTDEFKRRLPITLELVIFSFLFSTVMGISFGILSAVSQNSFWDYVVRLISVFGLSIPSFLLLTLLLILPARWWGYAPPFRATHF